MKHILLLCVALLCGFASSAAPAESKSGDAATAEAMLTNIFNGADPGALSVGGITVYGVVDITLAYQSHGTQPSPYMNGNYLIAKNSGGEQIHFTDNAMSQSLIGVKLDQPLALVGLRDWSLVSDAQIGFDPAFASIQDTCKSLVLVNGANNVSGTTANADSSRCGQLFNGEAYGGIKNDTYGTLRFGRQTSLMFYYIGTYDPQQLSFANSLFGLSGTYAGSLGDTQDKHWNNSLKYFNAIGPVHLASQYRFSGDGQGGRAYLVDGGIKGWGRLDGFSMDALWGRFYDGISVSSLTSSTAKTPAAGSCQSLGVSLSDCTHLNVLNAVVSDNKGWTVMTKYNLARLGLPTVTAMGGYEHIQYANPRATLPSGYETIGGYLLNYTSATFTTYTTDKTLHVSWFGAQWGITRKLSAAGGWYHFIQNSYVKSGAACTNPGSGTSTQSQCWGEMDWLSATLDYQLAKRLDVYGGYSYTHESGGVTNGYTYTSTNNVTTGFRFRF